MEQIKKWGKFSLGLLFSLAIIIWGVWKLDWVAVWQTLGQVHYGWVLAAVGFNLLTLALRVVRWGVFFQPHPLKFKDLFVALIIGQAANFISPARVGDFLRAYVLGQITGVSKAHALGTIALGKMWDTVMLLLFVGVLAWFFPLPPWLLESAWGLLILTVIAALGFGIILWRQSLAINWVTRASDRLAPRFRDRLVRFTQNILKGFDGATNKRTIISAGGWSFLAWLASGLLNYLVFLAFDLPLSFIPAFLLLIVLYVGVAVPSLPGRIGIFQGICVFVLALFGTPYSQAFSYGLILHLVVFLPPILLGGILSLRLNLTLSQTYRFDYD